MQITDTAWSGRVCISLCSAPTLVEKFEPTDSCRDVGSLLYFHPGQAGGSPRHTLPTLLDSRSELLQLASKFAKRRPAEGHPCWCAVAAHASGLVLLLTHSLKQAAQLLACRDVQSCTCQGGAIFPLMPKVHDQLGGRCGV